MNASGTRKSALKAPKSALNLYTGINEGPKNTRRIQFWKGKEGNRATEFAWSNAPSAIGAVGVAGSGLERPISNTPGAVRRFGFGNRRTSYQAQSTLLNPHYNLEREQYNTYRRKINRPLGMNTAGSRQKQAERLANKAYKIQRAAFNQGGISADVFAHFQARKAARNTAAAQRAFQQGQQYAQEAAAIRQANAAAARNAAAMDMVTRGAGAWAGGRRRTRRNRSRRNRSRRNNRR